MLSDSEHTVWERRTSKALEFKEARSEIQSDIGTLGRNIMNDFQTKVDAMMAALSYDQFYRVMCAAAARRRKK